nr:uncharacterized protein LOC111504033 [Leptinotarsa decemlineata]
MYEKIVKTDLGADVKIIDLRTDTISRPTQEMKEAMYIAEVGDDVYGEDPTVTELERRSAELLGKEDALFVASGTMANLIAIMVHCSQRGCEIISGDKAHTYRLEQGGTAQIAGVQTAPVKNKDDGTFSLDELREKIRKNPDMHEPITSLIIVEKKIEKRTGPSIKPESLTHTVIFRSRRIRKVLGGGWRQAGVLAAAGLVALDTMIDRLRIDHDHAFKIAKGGEQFIGIPNYIKNIYQTSNK